MTGPCKPAVLRWLLLGAVALAYFAFFPGDLAALVGPVEKVLGMSQAVSPWLYALAGVAIICSTLVRIWGGRRTAAAERQTSPPPP